MARVKVFECDVCRGSFRRFRQPSISWALRWGGAMPESNPVVVWQPPGWRSAIAGVIERPPEEVEHV